MTALVKLRRSADEDNECPFRAVTAPRIKKRPAGPPCEDVVFEAEPRMTVGAKGLCLHDPCDGGFVESVRR